MHLHATDSGGAVLVVVLALDSGYGDTGTACFLYSLRLRHRILWCQGKYRSKLHAASGRVDGVHKLAARIENREWCGVRCAHVEAVSRRG